MHMRHAISYDDLTAWSTTDPHADPPASHLVDLIQEWQNATDMLRDYADPPTQQALLAWQSLVFTFSFSLQLDDDIYHLTATLRQLHTIQDMRNLFQRMNCTLRFDAQETARIPMIVLQHFLSSTDRLSLLWMTMPILHRVATTMMENTQVLLDQKASRRYTRSLHEESNYYRKSELRDTLATLLERYKPSSQRSSRLLSDFGTSSSY